jgi:hypothetical protein
LQAAIGQHHHGRGGRGGGCRASNIAVAARSCAGASGGEGASVLLSVQRQRRQSCSGGGSSAAAAAHAGGTQAPGIAQSPCSAMAWLTTGRLWAMWGRVRAGTPMAEGLLHERLALLDKPHVTACIRCLQALLGADRGHGCRCCVRKRGRCPARTAAAPSYSVTLPVEFQLGSAPSHSTSCYAVLCSGSRASCSPCPCPCPVPYCLHADPN